MNRSLASVAIIVLVLSPLVALGAIGAAFLASSNEQPREFEPLMVDTFGPEPRLVPLLIKRRDAWMQTSPEPGGWAHVRRTASGKVVVLSASHPRMGDWVSYDRAAGGYHSDCFPWRFDLDGRWLPEPEYAKYNIRDMLSLDHRVDGGRIFIRAPIPLPTYSTEGK